MILYRRIATCYSSVDHSSGVVVVHSLSDVKLTMNALLKRRQWPASLDIFVVVTRRRGRTCDIQTNNYSANDKAPC